MQEYCNIVHIDEHIQTLICYELDVEDIVSLCSTCKKFMKLYEDLGFWRLYLIHKTGLDKSFFISYVEKENLYKLCINFRNYNMNNDYEYIKTHVNIVNEIYTSRVISGDINIPDIHKLDIYYTVVYGGLPFIKYMNNDNYIFDIEHLTDSIKHIPKGIVLDEYLRNILYIVNSCEFVDSYTFCQLVKNTNIDIVVNALKKLHSGTNRMFYNIPHCAIKSQDINIVKYIIDKFNITSISEFIFKTAISTGNIDVVKYIIDEFNLSIYFDHLEYAITTKNIDMIKYLAEEFNYINRNIFIKVIRTENIEIIDFFLKKFNIEITTDFFTVAIRTENISIIKYISHTFKRKINEHIFNTAIATYNEHVISYIVKRYGRKITVKSLKYAISTLCRSGRPQLMDKMLKIIDYLIDILNTRKDSSLLRYTISCKNIIVIEHIIKKYNLKVDIDTVKYAATTKDIKVFVYVLNKCDKCVILSNISHLSKLRKQCN